MSKFDISRINPKRSKKLPTLLNQRIHAKVKVSS